jgi:hypothetical protein
MRRAIPLLLLFLAALAAEARVISYAPYTNKLAIPAVQSRLNRHFVLLEIPVDNNGIFNRGQLVLYDTKGLEEPRVIFPADGSLTSINGVAVQEDDQQLAILVQGATPAEGYLSVDGGTTWKQLVLPVTNYFEQIFPIATDTGGPYVRGRYAQVRIGTHDVPFYLGPGSVSAIARDGSVKPLAVSTALPPPQIAVIGNSADGSRVLYTVDNQVFGVGATGVAQSYGTLPKNGNFAGYLNGWISPDGGAYVEQMFSINDTTLYYLKNGTVTFVKGDVNRAGPVASPLPPCCGTIGSPSFFAVPAADYDGAWMINRNASQSTALSFYKPATGVVKQWEDITAPEVEALHPAKSGSKVLIQVHRSRLTLDQLLFKDPALAVWHVGDPAPQAYDELFLSETTAKGFVHLDADKLEAGDPFVFDSGAQAQGGSVIISPAPPSAGGGSDVVQEWGVVRASLQQRLVLPGAARTAGAFGSFWLTDVTFYNPSTAAVTLQVTYAANGSRLTAEAESSRTVALAPNEIRTIPDVLKNLFFFESGGGALYITPETGRSVSVTSRTYTQASNGTFGFGMNAIDVFASASPRFPVSFSGAFLGPNYRTNLVVTDVSGRGTDSSLLAWGPFGPTGNTVTAYSVPGLGQQQFNFINAAMGVGTNDTGALVVQPTRGEAVATVFAVDNRTNDATYFPPDIPASVVRVIPAIGHLDGANGSKFRSDLYLFNMGETPKIVTLQAKVWGAPDGPYAIPLTLLPHEARTIPDVLKTVFGKEGIARLRYFAQGSANDTSVRVTSRTYTIDANGGTYGFLMPPLNSFQSGAPGDTLEILGASLDKKFRTNLGLIDLTPFGGNRPSRAKVEVVGDRGQSLDAFEITLPQLGGNQINDLFHARNLPESSMPVLIRVSVIEGSVGAYVAFVDNGTNDPAYFAANLAAKN